MRKKIKIGTFLTCTLVLIVLSNSVPYAAAAPPTWVGVAVGEKYSWDFKMDFAKLGEFSIDVGMGENFTSGNSSITNMFSTGFPAISLGLEIKYISDLISASPFNHVQVNCSPTISMAGVTSMNMGDYGIYMTNIMLDPSTRNYTANSIQVLSGAMTAFGSNTSITPPFYMPLALIFVPTNLNWTREAEDMQNYIDAYFNITNSASIFTISVAPSGYGLKFTIPTATLNITQKDITFTLSYNSQGVLGQFDLTYDGASMMSFVTSSDEPMIPGFEIPVMIAAICVASIGIIYYIKKKKQVLI